SPALVFELGDFLQRLLTLLRLPRRDDGIRLLHDLGRGLAVELAQCGVERRRSLAQITQRKAIHRNDADRPFEPCTLSLGQGVLHPLNGLLTTLLTARVERVSAATGQHKASQDDLEHSLHCSPSIEVPRSVSAGAKPAFLLTGPPQRHQHLQQLWQPLLPRPTRSKP